VDADDEGPCPFTVPFELFGNLDFVAVSAEFAAQGSFGLPPRSAGDGWGVSMCAAVVSRGGGAPASGRAGCQVITRLEGLEHFDEP
jgi:hypothetical protein